MQINIFGIKEENKEYIWRPAVYGLLFNEQNNKIALIRTNDGKYFLPGGGIENGETHVECLKRESIEEMGMEIDVGQFVGCAQRYFYSTNEYKYYLSEGYFYLCNIVKKVNSPKEADYLLLWVQPIDAIESLFHEHQSWAVNEGLRVRAWNSRNKFPTHGEKTL